jgi:hypothetical protein
MHGSLSGNVATPCDVYLKKKTIKLMDLFFPTVRVISPS